MKTSNKNMTTTCFLFLIIIAFKEWSNKIRLKSVKLLVCTKVELSLFDGVQGIDAGHEKVAVDGVQHGSIVTVDGFDVRDGDGVGGLDDHGGPAAPHDLFIVEDGGRGEHRRRRDGRQIDGVSLGAIRGVKG